MFSKFFASLQNLDDRSRIKLSIRILFIALIAGMLLSWRLWLTERDFPLTPLLSIPEFSRNISIDLFALILLFAFALVFLPSKKKLMISLFILLFLEFLGDQNRWQPWCYQYFLMLFLLLFYQTGNTKSESSILNAFRLIICGIYCWSGIQKLNPEFYNSTAAWLTEPVGQYFGSMISVVSLKITKIIPVVELFLAFGLMHHRTRTLAVWIAVVMHTYIILLVTPLGKNYNYVIIPWNSAMICFLFLIFRKGNDITLSSVFNTLKTKYVFPVFILVWLLPFLSLFGKWPSYLSASLYSGNSDNAYIYVSKRLKDSLPKELNVLVHTQEDTLYYVYVNEWSIKELQAPAYPEESVFKSARNVFLRFANDSDEVKLLVEKKFTLMEKSHYVYLK